MKRDEFYEFADVWYQRTHKLRYIWQDEKETPYRRLKAYYLFNIMLKRVLKLSQIAIVYSQPKPRRDV